MLGCVSRARIVPSRRKRSSPARPTRLALRSLTATRPFEAAVAAAGEPDVAHAALRRWARRACRRRTSGRRATRAADGCGGGALEKAFSSRARCCDASSASTSRGERRVGPREDRRATPHARSAVQVQRLVEERARPRPPIGVRIGHRPSSAPSRIERCRKRRAFSQLRCTVRSDAPAHRGDLARRRSRRRTSGRRPRRATESMPVRALRAPRGSPPGPPFPAPFPRTSSSVTISNSPPRFCARRLAGVVHDERSHDLRRIGHEARPIGKDRTFAPRHVEIGLVEERRRAERQPAAPPGQLPLRQSMQLGVKGRKERISGGPVAGSGRLHQGGNAGFHQLLVLY